MKKEIKLNIWSEVVGTDDGLVIEENFTHLRINSSVISFPNGTKEATLVRQFFNENMVGRKIGVLRTDLADKPLLFRIVG